MTNILHVNASPRGGESRSLTLADTFLEEYRRQHPELKIDSLNLFEERLPDFGIVAAAAKMAAFAGQPQTDAEIRAWNEARSVFDRFNSADEYVFNVPMWNHGVPYVLKQWIDIITQPGWVFGFHPEHGYNGLIQGKPAVVIYTTGVYRDGRGPNFGADFHATFFNDWLRFIGFTDVSELRFDSNVLDRDPEAALRTRQEEARELAKAFRG